MRFRDKVLNVSLILAIADSFIFLCSVLMAWVLSNVSDKSTFPLVQGWLTMCTSLSRRCWSLSFCKCLSCFPPFVRAHLARSTINGNAKTNGAKHTVNGYLVFIFYSVALRARASVSLSQRLILTLSSIFSSVVRFIGSTMYMIIRLFIGE